MPLARYREAGLGIGLGSDVAGGPELSLFTVMRAGAWSQVAHRTLTGDAAPLLGPMDWLRLGTLDGARALGLDGMTGSLEEGKAADVIAVDPRPTDAAPHGTDTSAEDLVSRLMFRTHAGMVQAAWVDGRRLEGPTSIRA